MARAAAALLPESFNVFRPIDKACFNRSASIGAEGAEGAEGADGGDEVRDELIDLFASVIIKIPKKAKIMVMEQTRLHTRNVLKDHQHSIVKCFL